MVASPKAPRESEKWRFRCHLPLVLARQLRRKQAVARCAASNAILPRMDQVSATANVEVFGARLREHGIQPTCQRIKVAALLLNIRQHLTAEQLLASLNVRGARVSKATLYNTLNLFAARGLIRQLSVDGTRMWFDSNVEPHYHFQDSASGNLSDIALGDIAFSRLPAAPEGMEVAGIDVVIRLRRKLNRTAGGGPGAQ